MSGKVSFTRLTVSVAAFTFIPGDRLRERRDSGAQTRGGRDGGREVGPLRR